MFPHPNLSLEVVLVEVEEWRYPGHGRRRRWRRDDHVVGRPETSWRSASSVDAAADLVKLIPGKLPKEFHTGHLADLGRRPPHVAQRIAYCLREMKAIDAIGKQGNAHVYRLAGRRRRARSAPQPKIAQKARSPHACYNSAGRLNSSSVRECTRCAAWPVVSC